MQLHRLEGYIQSLYLVEYPQGLLLLDGGCRVDVGRILRFIRDQLQRPIGDLKLVVVTHMHPDHAGAATRLREITGCRIAAGAAPGQWYGGFLGRLMHLADVGLAQYVASRQQRPLRNIWYPACLSADLHLNDGDLLPEFPDWQVVSTSGHTDRDISLLHRDERRIYVADLFVKVKTRFLPPWPIYHPNRYRASLMRLQALAPVSVILAHGGEVPAEDIDMAKLLAKAPQQPKTHWRAIKARFQRFIPLPRS
ncbi:MBL fold metallo-hydrolase [Ferrimonas gelatinilytica]|uniref:MBL fold metallo-hydrolase n=1 Tax=Ferrimonas gelatinilytica TaxID=1255257 RepID=A0ABP9RWI4_9GAMM